MASDVEAVRNVVEQWRARFQACDAEGLKDLWDSTHPTLTYLATERELLLTDWQDIAGYYDRFASGGIQVFEWRTWDVIGDVLSPTDAFAFAYTSMWYRSGGDPPDVDNYWAGRISFHLKSTPAGWKIVHYEDSTLMQWMLPLVTQYQAPVLAELTSLISAGKTDEALAVVGRLGEPISFPALTRIAKRPD